MNNASFTEVMREWKYILDTYGNEMPFIVLLYNCNDRIPGKLTNLELGADIKGQYVKLVVEPDNTQQSKTIMCREDCVWKLKYGKSSKGRTIFTKEI